MTRKFSLLMIAGAASLMTLAGCGAYALTANEQDQVELGARDYAERAGNSFVSCSGQDSDGDGYVTCATQTPDGAAEEIVCSYEARGCKRKVTNLNAEPGEPINVSNIAYHETEASLDHAVSSSWDDPAPPPRWEIQSS